MSNNNNPNQRPEDRPSDPAAPPSYNPPEDQPPPSAASGPTPPYTSAPPPPAASAEASSSSSSSSPSSASQARAAYDDLRRLIPSLAEELDHLRASLREHNIWLQRYGHAGPSAPAPAADDLAFARPPPSSASSSSSVPNPAPAASAATTTPAAAADPDLPAYSASDVPPYTGGPSLSTSATRTATVEEVRESRDRLAELLGEYEDVLREYSARLAQLREELGLPLEDVLGTWSEAGADNALPDYRAVEEREELMVGGVGEVPPPYLGGGGAAEKGRRG